MASRLQVKVISADKTEIEQINMDFEELNKSIENKICEYNKRIDEQIELLFESDYDKQIDDSYFINYYEDKLKNKDSINFLNRMETYNRLLESWKKHQKI